MSDIHDTFTKFFSDASAWIAVSFLIFFGLFVRFLLPHILKALDSRAHKIQEQLEQATLLRKQAEAMLADIEKERATNAQETEKRIAEAEAEISALRAQTEAELENLIARRTKQTAERIARTEHDAMLQVRQQILDKAILATTESIQKHLATSNTEDPAIADALGLISASLH